MDVFENAAVLHAPVNWSDEFSVEWSFKTDIFEARDGGESRKSERVKPRRTFEYSVLLEGAAGRLFRQTMAHYGGSLMVVGDPTHSYPVPVFSEGNIQVIPMNTIPGWAAVGKPIVVTYRSTNAVRRILAVTGNAITISAPAPAGPRTTISPAIFGRVEANARLTMHTTNANTFAMVFEEEPTVMDDPVAPGVDPTPMWRRFPVMTIKPNWGTAMTATFNRRESVVDYDFGAKFTHLLEPQARWNHDFSALGKNRDAVRKVEDFFCRRRGRRGAFYTPTWQKDFIVVRGATPGSSAVEVRGENAHELFINSFMYRNICFITRKGMIFSGVKRSYTENGNSVLVLDTVLPQQVEDQRFMCWVVMARFASDQMKIDWKTDQVAEYDINVYGLLDRFYDFNIMSDRITFRGDYLTFPPFPKLASYIPVDDIFPDEIS